MSESIDSARQLKLCYDYAGPTAGVVYQSLHHTVLVMSEFSQDTAIISPDYPYPVV